MISSKYWVSAGTLFHNSLVFQEFYFHCKRADELCLEATAIVQISSAALRISLGGEKAKE